LGVIDIAVCVRPSGPKPLEETSDQRGIEVVDPRTGYGLLVEAWLSSVGQQQLYFIAGEFAITVPDTHIAARSAQIFPGSFTPTDAKFEDSSKPRISTPPRVLANADRVSRTERGKAFSARFASTSAQSRPRARKFATMSARSD
jgi:hypothetical protein